MLSSNLLAYYATRIFTPYLTFHSPELPIDSYIPFIPAFVSVYVLAYVQWIASYIITARESREVCSRYIYGAAAAKLICMVVFLVYPTCWVRPDAVGEGFWNGLVRFMYSIDSPDHLFPSIHCLESWICFRASLRVTKVGSWYRVFSLVFAILVFASTVFIKQHCFIDIIGGVVAAELGILIRSIVRRLNARRLDKRTAEKGSPDIEPVK